jgi:hypothetical protein
MKNAAGKKVCGMWDEDVGWQRLEETEVGHTLSQA